MQLAGKFLLQMTQLCFAERRHRSFHQHFASHILGIGFASEGDRAATPDAERSKLLELYVEHFNRRDWDAVRALTSADARLRVSDRFAGRLAESPYFSRYEHSAWRWAMSLGEVDGEAVVIMQSPVADGWQPTSVVRIDVEDGRIVRIHDYYHCPWIIGAADVRVLSAPSQHKPLESNHG